MFTICSAEIKLVNAKSKITLTDITTIDVFIICGLQIYGKSYDVHNNVNVRTY